MDVSLMYEKHVVNPARNERHIISQSLTYIHGFMCKPTALNQFHIYINYYYTLKKLKVNID